MKTLHISAGGKGERIADYIAANQSSLPKHLLPIPTQGKSLLGEIVTKAQDFFQEIWVWANPINQKDFLPVLNLFTGAKVIIDEQMTGPLGPMIRALLTTEKRVYGCAGDYYCDFFWADFESFHDSHGLPISILVAQSLSAPKGARFNLVASKIVSWERVPKTTTEDRINIGCYIIDPEKLVMTLLSEMTRHKEDVFFDTFVPRKLVAGYDPGIKGYNINVPEIYIELLKILGMKGHTKPWTP